MLIERYLYYFVLVTKHGTYIDGFAGPQDADRPESWAARLVLESEPKRLRHFHLCELEPQRVGMLKDLKREHENPRRQIEVYPGDFNKRVRDILTEHRLEGGHVLPTRLANIRVPLDRQWVIDLLNRTVGAVEEKVRIERRHALNPAWWLWSMLVFVLRIAFILLSAAGFNTASSRTSCGRSC